MAGIESGRYRDRPGQRVNWTESDLDREWQEESELGPRVAGTASGRDRELPGQRVAGTEIDRDREWPVQRVAWDREWPGQRVIGTERGQYKE